MHAQPKAAVEPLHENDGAGGAATEPVIARTSLQERERLPTLARANRTVHLGFANQASPLRIIP